jgi:hypothetical protein
MPLRTRASLTAANKLTKLIYHRDYVFYIIVLRCFFAR